MESHQMVINKHQWISWDESCTQNSEKNLLWRGMFRPTSRITRGNLESFGPWGQPTKHLKWRPNDPRVGDGLVVSRCFKMFQDVSSHFKPRKSPILGQSFEIKPGKVGNKDEIIMIMFHHDHVCNPASLSKHCNVNCATWIAHINCMSSCTKRRVIDLVTLWARTKPTIVLVGFHKGYPPNHQFI